MKTEKNINKLPLWAQNLLKEKDKTINSQTKKIETLEKMIPWVTGKNDAKMEWFTIFHPSVTLPHEPITIFRLQENAAQPLCTLGPQDCVFIGRTLNKK